MVMIFSRCFYQKSQTVTIAFVFSLRVDDEVFKVLRRQNFQSTLTLGPDLHTGQEREKKESL